MKVNLHKNDIPPSLKFGSRIAIDTETMGLKPERDRLCLVQLSAGDGNVHLVQFKDGVYNAPNLTALMTNQDIIKIFHFARFDLAVIKKQPIYSNWRAIRSKNRQVFGAIRNIDYESRLILTPVIRITKLRITSYLGRNKFVEEIADGSL